MLASNISLCAIFYLLYEATSDTSELFPWGTGQIPVGGIFSGNTS